jgi:hypothetical protein
MSKLVLFIISVFAATSALGFKMPLASNNLRSSSASSSMMEMKGPRRFWYTYVVPWKQPPPGMRLYNGASNKY